MNYFNKSKLRILPQLENKHYNVDIKDGLVGVFKKNGIC